MKRLLQILSVTLLVTLICATAGWSTGVSISVNNGYLSISSNIALAAQPTQRQVEVDAHGVIMPSGQREHRLSEAISVSTLGTNSDKAATSPWTALTGLSITAEDYVFVCDSADAGSTAVSAILDNTVVETQLTGSVSDWMSPTSEWNSQSFTTTSAHNIVGVVLSVTANLTPKTRTLYARLYASDADDKPTGSILSSGSLNKTYSENEVWETIPMTTYAMADATKYVIVLYASLDNMAWCYSNASVYASGKSGVSTDSGSTWTVSDINDRKFKIVSVIGETVSLTADVTATNAGAVVTKIWSGKVTVTGTAYYIVITNTSTAKAMTAYKASGLASTALDKYTFGTGTSANATAGPTDTLTQADELCIGATGVEDEVDDGHGTWTNGASYISGNEQFNATNGGGDSSNIQVHSVAEVVSATTAQNIADTGHDSSNFAACIATYKMAPAYDLQAISPSSKDFGFVVPSTTYWSIGHTPDNPIDDAHCTFTLTNAGIQCDIDVHSHNFTGGGGWTLGNPAGATTARLSIGKSGDNPASPTVLTTSDQEIYDALAVGAHFHFDVRLETPTSAFPDGTQRTTTITFTAVAED